MCLFFSKTHVSHKQNPVLKWATQVYPEHPEQCKEFARRQTTWVLIVTQFSLNRTFRATSDWVASWVLFGRNLGNLIFGGRSVK